MLVEIEWRNLSRVSHEMQVTEPQHIIPKKLSGELIRVLLPSSAEVISLGLLYDRTFMKLFLSTMISDQVNVFYLSGQFT